MRLALKNGESLTAVLAAAPATTNPTTNVCYSDRGIEESASGSTNGDTAATLLAGSTEPSRRVISSVSVCNIDTAAVTVTLKHVVSGTGYTLAAVTLQVGDILQLDAAGVRVVDSAGKTKSTVTSTTVQPFAIPATRWTRTDGITVNSASAGTTNHGLIMGTDGTNFPHLETIDGKAATTVVVSRAIVSLPANYVAGSAITIRIRAGMKTTVADNTNATTVDLNVYSNAGTTQAGSADLCTTDAQSCNSLTNADKDFVITPTGLVAGQDLHIKLSQTITDAATDTAVIGTVVHAELRTAVSN